MACYYCSGGVAALGRRGGGVVSTLPFECWRVPQSLENGGNAFQHVASADNNLNHK
jgi:hypothetical protein